MLYTTYDWVDGTPYAVDWGNGTSVRLVIAADGRGYTVTDTYVRPGTSTPLRFDRHFESCYCVEGGGRVETTDATYDIAPGVLYAPNLGEEHRLVAGPDGMRLICVFNPPLTGTETHTSDPDRPSGY
ncbi:ectoine synthase [Micromonospora sp. STR1s_5]|nr:ectoine synthase [Micromonospora sp. STR1s_5]